MWEMKVLSQNGNQIGKTVNAMLWDFNELIEFILNAQEMGRTVLINGEDALTAASN